MAGSGSRSFPLVDLPAVGRPERSAFTLVELLVVIAIIALLVSILVPTLQSAMALARRAGCASQLRGIQTAIVGYASEFNNVMPCRGDGDVWLPDTGGQPATQNLGLVWRAGYFGTELAGAGAILFEPDASETPGWTHQFTKELCEGGAGSRQNFANPDGHVYSRITYAYRYHPRQSSGYTSSGWKPPIVSLEQYPDVDSTNTVRAWVSCLQSSLSAPYPMRVVSHGMDGCNAAYYDGTIKWVDNPSSDRSEPGPIANYHPLQWFGGANPGGWWIGLADDAL